MAVHAAVQPRMNLAHGGRAALVALAAEVTGTSVPDHSIEVALISVSGGFVVMVGQFIIADWIRRRRPPATPPPPPPHPDHAEEQAILNELLIEKMERLQAENDRLRRKGQR